MPTASLCALLTQAIDYAGLFPPASLELEPALRNYAEYAGGPDVRLLGAFILPVAQFGAAARGIFQFEKDNPLRVSALGPRTDNAGAFPPSLSAAMESIASFRAASGGVVSVEQFEMPLPPIGRPITARPWKWRRAKTGACSWISPVRTGAGHASS